LLLKHAPGCVDDLGMQTTSYAASVPAQDSVLLLVTEGT
jgi:hypothetical protein